MPPANRARNGYAGNQCLVPPKIGVLGNVICTSGASSAPNNNTAVSFESTLRQLPPSAAGFNAANTRSSCSPSPRIAPSTPSNNVDSGTVNNVMIHEYDIGNGGQK